MIPIRTSTAHEDYHWIWAGDDALDRDSPDFETEYMAALESGCIERLPMKPGGKPTIFTLRHPSPLLKRYFLGLASSELGPHWAMRRIAQLSIVKAEPYPGVSWRGIDPGLGLPMVPDDTMNALDEVEGLVNGIANAVLERMRPKN